MYLSDMLSWKFILGVLANHQDTFRLKKSAHRHFDFAEFWRGFQLTSKNPGVGPKNPGVVPKNPGVVPKNPGVAGKKIWCGVAIWERPMNTPNLRAL